MIIGACFFGFYSAIFFIGSFGPNLTGMLGPATATGILAFMFIMLARSPKTETHIGKISKPAFVILCLIAMLLSGIIITRLTNQTPSQSQNQSPLVNEQSDNTQSNSSVQDNAKSIIDTKSEVLAEKQTQTTEYSQKRPISKYDNLSFGIPGPADTIIDRIGYALGYIEKHEQPAWVIYRMTADEATTKAVKRGDDFRPDPQIPTGSATLADYRSSGYDRGHLAPAADMAFSGQTMSDSFYMSNMSPQKPAFNRGVWMNLEAQIRQFAISEKDIYVVTGPIFPKDKTITVGSNAVTVPPAYYKVVYDLTPPQKMIGFIVPHEGSKASLSSFAVTVDAVEDATGLNFFSTLSEDQQAALEGTITIDAWDWSKFKNSGSGSKSFENGSVGGQKFPNATGKYWVSSSGLRHNSSCTYFRNSNGHGTDDPDAGKRDCKRCGGSLR
jgi:endonuclease G